MKVEIFVEGGASHLISPCREAFRQLFIEAGLAGNLPRVYPCGSRQSAFEDFCLALTQPGTIVLLLVDSEEPITNENAKWNHVERRQGDQWRQPTGATEDSLHFMVECMESWLLADLKALKKYFVKTVIHPSPPPQGNWEKKSKDDLVSRLDRIAKGTPKKFYHKGRDSFAILKYVHPEALKPLPHATAFLDYLRTICT